MNAVGSHIKKLRKQRGLSQQALAEQLNVTRQAVSQWENGISQPDLDTLTRIAEVLGVDILEVIYGEKGKAAKHLTPYQRKRHWTGFILFGAVALVAWVLSLTLKPYLLDWMKSYYITTYYFIYCYFAEPLLYISIPLALLHGCSLIWNIRVRHQGIARIMLAAGAVYILLYAVAGIGVCLLREGLFVSICSRFLWFMLMNPAVFLLPGASLFFGFNGCVTTQGAAKVSPPQ